MIRHVITIHAKQIMIEEIITVVQETWMKNIRIEEDEEYIDPSSIKKIKLILNHMKKSGKGYYSIKSN